MPPAGDSTHDRAGRAGEKCAPRAEGEPSPCGAVFLDSAFGGVYKARVLKTVLRIISAAIAVFAVAMLLQSLFRSETRRVTVRGREGERSVTVVSGELHRNDEVVYYAVPPAKGAHLARVVALPGQRVRVKAGTLHVDGSPHRGPKLLLGRSMNIAEIVIPTGHLFLVGEERGPDSLKFGPFPKTRVAGKVARGGGP